MLQCAIKSGNEGACPYENCGQPVCSDSDEMNEFNSLIDCLFREVSVNNKWITNKERNIR